MHKFTQISDMPNMVYVSPKMIDDRVEASYYKKQYLDVDEKIVTFNNGFMYLKNLCTKITDGTHKTPDYKPEGIKFITAKNILEDGIDFEDVKYISKDEHNEISKRCKVEPGDMLFTKVGRIGYAKVVPANVPNFSIFVSVALLKLKGNVDSRFIEAFLNSKYGRIQSERLVKGSNQPDFHLEDITEIKVPIPSPEIQKYIGDKVRKAEELREEAKRLKKEAEEILNAELKLSYFNERVKDAPKMYNWIYGESIEVRIDSQYYINETNFINNEMYKKGLKLKRISEIANVGKGFSYTSLDNKSIPYIRISDLDDLLINFDTVELVDEKTYLEKKSSQLEQCDLIFAITGATIGKVSLFYTSKHSKATLSSDTAFVRLQDKNDAAYVLLYLKSFIGQLGILKGVTGATNRHLSLEHIGDIFIPVIDNKLKREINMRVIKAIDNVYLSKQLIQEAKQDVEDLIEGNFDTSKVRANS